MTFKASSKSLTIPKIEVTQQLHLQEGGKEKKNNNYHTLLILIYNQINF